MIETILTNYINPTVLQVIAILGNTLLFWFFLLIISKLKPRITKILDKMKMNLTLYYAIPNIIIWIIDITLWILFIFSAIYLPSVFIINWLIWIILLIITFFIPQKKKK